LNNTNYHELEKRIDHKYFEKENLEKENEEINQLKEQLQKNEQSYHTLELDMKNKQHTLRENDITINDFEHNTEFDNVAKFVKVYESNLEKIKEYDSVCYKLEQNILNSNQQLSIEENSKAYLESSLKELKNELENMNLKIDEEMARIGFTQFEQVKATIVKVADKDKIEAEINTYNKEKQSLELVIAQLSEETKNKKLQDSQHLKEVYQQKQQVLEEIATELSQHEYKIDFNQKKINEINTIIEKLEKELKAQQEVFQLAEILSGKNDQKLTLENYVLIYYLERILAQANQRLALMTGQRYQLTRREQISQGYSGLEIDVFDSHSNQSRHISSLSGGETFQASLALALGLSEVVQQESGGIALDSMFVDEGFGTLDQETLETALDTLLSLKSTGRMVGIISHVSELKQRIPLILEVSTEQYQSTTQFKRQ
ncbi:ATP-binding cassette family protein, partial [Staphylococcus equorum]